LKDEYKHHWALKNAYGRNGFTCSLKIVGILLINTENQLHTKLKRDKGKEKQEENCFNH
jgi:hypothetical protein